MIPHLSLQYNHQNKLFNKCTDNFDNYFDIHSYIKPHPRKPQSPKEWGGGGDTPVNHFIVEYK